MLKSKSKFRSLFIALSILIGTSGCAELFDANSSQTINNQTIDKKATIQGGVFDAVTGARIGGNDLKMTLVAGTSDRSPSKLNKDTNSDLMGEYAFSDVPVNVDGGNITFKMVITNTGYQRFEGTVTYNVAEGEIGGGTTTDATINLIRDVYLFPLGVTAPDIEVAVEYDGEPVPGATVVLQQNATGNSATAETSATRLFATTGLLPTLTATTDAAGKVTFAGSTLVLGGAYTPVVLPIKHEGTQLARNILAGIVAGTSTNPILATMADTSPGAQDDGIFVVFASNRDVDDITGLTNPGVLTLVFNRAVALNNATGNPFTATLVNAGAALLNGAGTATSVAGVLSADGLTLTLTPQFTTAPIATDINLDVVFAGGQLTVAGDEGAQASAVFGLTYLDGVIISGTVNVTGPGA